MRILLAVHGFEQVRFAEVGDLDPHFCDRDQADDAVLFQDIAIGEQVDGVLQPLSRSAAAAVDGRVEQFAGDPAGQLVAPETVPEMLMVKTLDLRHQERDLGKIMHISTALQVAVDIARTRVVGRNRDVGRSQFL